MTNQAPRLPFARIGQDVVIWPLALNTLTA